MSALETVSAVLGILVILVGAISTGAVGIYKVNRLGGRMAKLESKFDTLEQDITDRRDADKTATGLKFEKINERLGKQDTVLSEIKTDVKWLCANIHNQKKGA